MTTAWIDSRTNRVWIDECEHVADSFFADLAESQALHDRYGRLASRTWPPQGRPTFPARDGFLTTWRGQPIHDEHGHRPYIRDAAGRRWLLDGSGDVA